MDQFQLTMTKRQDVPDVLSEEEIGILKQHFVQPDVAKEDVMLQNFMVAKLLVHGATVIEADGR